LAKIFIFENFSNLAILLIYYNFVKIILEANMVDNIVAKHPTETTRKMVWFFPRRGLLTHVLENWTHLNVGRAFLRAPFQVNPTPPSRQEVPQ